VANDVTFEDFLFITKHNIVAFRVCGWKKLVLTLCYIVMRVNFLYLVIMIY